MTTETWQKLRDLYEEALLLPESERWQLAGRQTDAEIRAELAKLIEAMDRSETFLEDPFRSEAKGGDLPRFGNYAALRKLGQGGMGSVWLARRDDGQFDHTVAVKVIRGGGGPDLERRFLQERQALAALHHPNIARLLDGGATEDGDPYLVMDYIEGEPLDAYAETRRLQLHARLELVVQLCRALEYAHERRVLHCDIKPPNVLVDGSGHVYLLDFGLARYLEEAASAERTRTILRAATPEYASPEALTGRAVTEASDVYSVGVVLYQLIAGKRPYQLDATALADLNRYFETRPIPRLPETASNELQLVAFRALHTDPKRRYASIRALREDIDRILAGRAVLARPDSISYRVTQWAHRRPRVAQAITGALIVAIVALAAVWSRPVGRLTILSYVTPAQRYSVALASFTDPASLPQAAWLSGKLDSLLRSEIEAAGVFRVSDAQATRIRADVARPGGPPVSPESMAALRASGADILLAGTYEVTDSNPAATLRMKLWAVDAKTGKAQNFAFSSSVAEMEAVMARACRTLSERFGDETYAARSRHFSARRDDSDRLLAQGMARLRMYDLLGARAALERSVHRSSANVFARAALAQVMDELGYTEDARQQIRTAAELGPYASRAERDETAAVEAELDEDWSKALPVRRAQLAAAPAENGRQFALGEDLLGARQFDELKRLIQADAPKAADVWGRFAWTLLKVKMIRWTAGRPAGLAAAEELLTAAHSLDSPILNAETFETASEMYAAHGKRPRSIEVLWGARALFAKAGHREGVARVSATLAQRLHNSKRTDEAIELAQNTLRDIQGAGFTESEQWLEFNLGTAYAADHRPDLARTYFAQVLSESTKPYGRFDKRRLVWRLGLALLDLGEMQEALRRLGDAVPSSAADPEYVRNVRDLADAELAAGAVRSAAEHLRKVEPAAQQEGQPIPDWISVREERLAVLQGDASRIDAAFGAVADKRQENLDEPPAVAEMHWGRALLIVNRPADAVSHFRKAIEGFEARAQPFDITAAEVFLATALARSGKAAEAKRELAKAAPDVESTPYAERRADFANATAQIELAAGAKDGLDALQAAATAYRKGGYLPRALYAELQLARLRHDQAAQSKVAAEAAAAGIGLY